VVGGGLRLVKEASVDDGDGVDGGRLDRNAWVEEVGGGGLEELNGSLGHAICPRKGSSDSHLSGHERNSTLEQTKLVEQFKEKLTRTRRSHEHRTNIRQPARGSLRLSHQESTSAVTRALTRYFTPIDKNPRRDEHKFLHNPS
jgi:hypothetical protein